MPKRIQRRRTKGWRMPEGVIYVGRPSIWGNPFQVGCHARIGGHIGGPGPIAGFTWQYCIAADWQAGFTTLLSAADCVEWYRRLVENGWHKNRLAELRGHDLACWCPLDKECHASVLLEICNR